MPTSGSPRLIAGSHVLHRLLAPRHPPYALSSLTIKPAQHTLPAGGTRLKQAMALTQLTLSIFGRRRTIQLSKINFEVSKTVVPDSAPQPADGWSRITSLSNSSSTFDLDAFRRYIPIIAARKHTQSLSRGSIRFVVLADRLLGFRARWVRKGRKILRPAQLPWSFFLLVTTPLRSLHGPMQNSHVRFAFGLVNKILEKPRSDCKRFLWRR